MTTHEAYTKKLRDNVIKCYRKEPATLDELAEAIVAIINNSNPKRLATHSGVPKTVSVLGFAWDIKYSNNVSNSHSAPRTGTTNFCSEDSKGPTSYPGFQGRVWIRYANNKNFSFGSDPFYETMSHPGTGGGGSYDGEWENISHAHYKTFGHRHNPDYPHPELFSWDYKIFLDDWPLIKEMVEKERAKVELLNTYRILANQRREVFKLSHAYSWNDPATKLADDKFLAKFYS